MRPPVVVALRRLAAAILPVAAALTAALSTAWSPAVAASPAPLLSQAPGACVDFYQHVNADWLQRTELPPERARIGSFDQLAIDNQRRLKAALDRLVAEPARQDTPGLKLLAAWYGGAADDAVAEQAGLSAARPLLERIAALEDRRALPALLAEFARHRIAVPVTLAVWPDPRDVRRHAVLLGAEGLGLPDRDDYLKDDATSQRLRAAWRRHAERLLQLAGVPHDAATLDGLLAFETTLARATLDRIERRDPRATDHRRSPAALAAEAPGFDWPAWLVAAGVPVARLGDAAGTVPLVVTQPKFMQAVGQLAAEAPLATWQAYLRVHLLDALSPWLAADFRTSHFEYRERTLRGLRQPPPRHEQLIRLIGGSTGFEPMGLALGELFVRESFSPRAQARALLMIEDIRAAMAERIAGLDWMGPATKARAQAKLAAMAPQVGAPATWPTYPGLVFDRAAPAGNWLQVQAWAWRDRLAQLEAPVDRLRWQNGAHIVNAFAGGMNRIIFPAGILQPPFFDEAAEDALNYGAIGMVIGHEITHHFDDRGRQYDEHGNLADWWTPEDAAAYRARADRVVALYGRYEALPGLFINGRQMLGENISDLGGLQIAYDAWRRAQARQPAPVVDGRTPEQRFFIANAVVWRSLQRNEALEQQIRTGQHSPGPFRVRGPMSNMPAFAAAFGCKAGDPMVAEDPVAVW